MDRVCLRGIRATRDIRADDQRLEAHSGLRARRRRTGVAARRIRTVLCRSGGPPARRARALDLEWNADLRDAPGVEGRADRFWTLGNAVRRVARRQSHLCAARESGSRAARDPRDHELAETAGLGSWVGWVAWAAKKFFDARRTAAPHVLSSAFRNPRALQGVLEVNTVTPAGPRISLTGIGVCSGAAPDLAIRTPGSPEDAIAIDRDVTPVVGAQVVIHDRVCRAEFRSIVLEDGDRDRFRLQFRHDSVLSGRFGPVAAKRYDNASRKATAAEEVQLRNEPRGKDAVVRPRAPAQIVDQSGFLAVQYQRRRWRRHRCLRDHSSQSRRLDVDARCHNRADDDDGGGRPGGP